MSVFGRIAAVILLLPAVLLGTGGCRETVQQMDVQLTIGLENDALPGGGPMEMTYRWQVAADAAPVSDDYSVFIHFWSEDGEIHWQDDHRPPIPTSQWRPGQVVEYRRIHFASPSTPAGEITITAGLYDQRSSRKVLLTGHGESERKLEYEVTRFELLPVEQLPIIIFDQGWYNREVGQRESGGWRWSQGEAVCWVESPGRPCSLFLKLQAPVNILNSAQRVTLEVEDTLLAELVLDSGEWDTEKIPIPEDLIRDRGCFRLVVRTDKVAHPPEKENSSHQQRELGAKFQQLIVY